MNTFSHVPPGFRFHPTDEELVDYYLRKKIIARKIDLDVIKDVDLYKIEPWDLQEVCKIGSEEQNEWYFFSHKDKKYPTGSRTNRATKAGFWKATGRDKAIYLKHCLIGMRKTLVFYKGRAPNGLKSDWIMHEYRLQSHPSGPPQEEGWVVCRVFKKRLPTVRKLEDSPCWYDDQVSFMPHIDSHYHPDNHHRHSQNHHNNMNACKRKLELPCNNIILHHDPFIQLPQLESPNKIPTYESNCNLQSSTQYTQEQIISQQQSDSIYGNDCGSDQVMDWRMLDKFVASQLISHNDHALHHPSSKESNYSNALIFDNVFDHMSMVVSPNFNNKGLGVGSEYASTSTSSCQIDK